MAAPPTALFKVLASFTVFGIGYILVGDRLEGEIHPGDQVELLVNGQLEFYLIIEVESVDRATESTRHTGLVIPYGSEEELEGLKRLELAGQVLRIVAA